MLTRSNREIFKSAIMYLQLTFGSQFRSVFKTLPTSKMKAFCING